MSSVSGLSRADWLDRPIAELTGAKLIELHQQIKERAAKRTGTNPANEKGAPLANRVIAHVSASWRSLNKKLEGKLGSWNPASAVDKDTTSAPDCRSGSRSQSTPST